MSKAAKRERQRRNRELRRHAEDQWLRRRRLLRIARTVAIPIVIVIAVGVIINVVRDGDDDDTDAADDPVEATPVDLPEGCELDTPPPMELDDAATYAATVETSEGTFAMTLDAAQAPQTVNAFVYQARNGCYDGLAFHRVAQTAEGEAFVIQGGDPAGDGTGGFGYTLPDEPPAEGYEVGMVAMANAGPGTTGSQFFVVLSEAAVETLEGLGGPPFNFSVLGQITSGFEVAEAIYALVPPGGDGPPTETVTITSITVSENDEPVGATLEG